MKLRYLVLFSFLTGFVGTACGGSTKNDKKDEPPATSAEGKEETCEEFCDSLSVCDGFDDAGCVDNCADGELTSRGGQEVLTECFDEDVCEFDEVAGLSALACVADGLDDLEASAAGETYCEESVERIQECLGGMDPGASLFGDCEDTIALASDEFLEELNDCAQKDCDAMETCVFLEVAQNLPLDDLEDLEAGDVSPAVFAELLALGIVLAPLGIDATGTNPFDPSGGFGGAAN